MEDKKLVSVIIPVYKTEKYLQKAVDSVLNQTYKNIEIILVDDGSPDSSPEICDNLANQFENIVVIHKDNGGLSSARNAGIEEINGEYVFFLDSDDSIEETTLADMVEIAEKEKTDAVFPNSYYKVYENLDEKDIAFHFTEDMFESKPIDYVLNILLGKARGQRSTAVLYRAATIVDNNIKFPIGLVSEDFFFMLDFMTVAKSLSVYTKPSLLNLKRLGSISGTFQSGFENTIWLMDDKVNEYLKKMNREDAVAAKMADALLCRNIVTYLFSVMSGINPMSYTEKKKMAKYILFHEKTRNVWKQSQTTPYFQSRATKLAYTLIYKLLKFGFIDLALWIMTYIKRKGR